MTGRTHLATGLIAGTIIATATKGQSHSEIGILFSTSVGSLFPDIDYRHSKLGTIMWPISYPINIIFGHRGFVHSPLCYCIIAVLFAMLFGEYIMYIRAFLVGVTCHLLFDMLTPEGIPLLWPKQQKYHLASIPTGSFLETIFFTAVLVLTVHLWTSNILI